MITGMLWSTPMKVVLREAGLMPVVSLRNNRQWRYDIRLLTAQVTQPVRDILPVTLREGEE